MQSCDFRDLRGNSAFTLANVSEVAIEGIRVVASIEEVDFGWFGDRTGGSFWKLRAMAFRPASYG